MSGCCAHCWDMCAGRATPIGWNDFQHFAISDDGEYSMRWNDDNCPACGEAERIAAEYDDNREDAP